MAAIPGDGVSVRETVPEKPLRAVTLMVDVPEVPGAKVILEGLADREKSGIVCGVTVTVTTVECESDPLVPVTVTENVPLEFVPIVSVAVPDPVMLVGLMIAPIPEE